MKTQEIKQKKRYQVIADNRKKIADKLMETMGVSQEEYGSVIFQAGSELLDNYFGDLEETPYIAEMKKQLLRHIHAACLWITKTGTVRMLQVRCLKSYGMNSTAIYQQTMSCMNA